MPIQELTTQQIDALVGTRHPVVDFLYPQNGLQPYYHWLVRTLHQIAGASAGGFKVDPDESAPTVVRIAPGRASVNGVALDYAGGTIDLALFNNDTALLWLFDDSGAAGIGTDPASAGWPTAAHVRLAEVTLDAGQIAQVLDRRGESLFSSALAASVDDLSQTIDDPPTQAQVQAIQDKLNELLAALRDAGQLAG